MGIGPHFWLYVLIAAHDVRLLVYRTVALCSKKLYPKNKFLATPLLGMSQNMALRPWHGAALGVSTKLLYVGPG